MRYSIIKVSLLAVFFTSLYSEAAWSHLNLLRPHLITQDSQGIANRGKVSAQKEFRVNNLWRGMSLTLQELLRLHLDIDLRNRIPSRSISDAAYINRRVWWTTSREHAASYVERNAFPWGIKVLIKADVLNLAYEEDLGYTVDGRAIAYRTDRVPASVANVKIYTLPNSLYRIPERLFYVKRGLFRCLIISTGVISRIAGLKKTFRNL